METVPIPGGTLVEKAFPRVDYADAYRTPAVGTAPELARRMLAGRSRMGGRLLRIRDALVRPFGVQPAHRGSSEVRIEAGGARGPFHALEVSDEEVFGEDDRHLDYRVSLQLARDRLAMLSTVVRFHGNAGRAYFLIVRPFHRVLARRLLAAVNR
ncbi:MAG: DUF2867 domain-containing protein [Deltaproteobacteria bacterium]|nr:MAG: DUF2867 domain-containing protein [Deltaproteobacteria bacterium]